MKAFVDFYKQEKISPVSQDISDQEKHFWRRNALYRHLGIIPGFVRGRRVLEFGPGSGHNSVHTAALGPGEYVLVEANPTGIKSIRALFNEHLEDQSNISITESLIEDFESDEPFDIVLCEGLLPLQENPLDLLRHVARFVAPGGVLVITCTDAVGYLAEILRRLVAVVLTRPEDSTQQKLSILLPVFSPHLAQIEGMNRPHEDYILDNIIQPFSGRVLFSMQTAIELLDGTLNFYSASPHFVTDWRWYKKITGNPSQFNAHGIEAFQDNLHNTMDSRTSPVPHDRARNVELLAAAGAVYDDILLFEAERDPTILDRIDSRLSRISEITEAFSSVTRDSVQHYRRALGELRNGRKDPDWGSFAGWFGQAQLYVSFLRNH